MRTSDDRSVPSYAATSDQLVMPFLCGVVAVEDALMKSTFCKRNKNIIYEYLIYHYLITTEKCLSLKGDFLQSFWGTDYGVMPV